MTEASILLFSILNPFRVHSWGLLQWLLAGWPQRPLFTGARFFLLGPYWAACAELSEDLLHSDDAPVTVRCLVVAACLPHFSHPPSLIRPTCLCSFQCGRFVLFIFISQTSYMKHIGEQSVWWLDEEITYLSEFVSPVVCEHISVSWHETQRRYKRCWRDVLLIRHLSLILE